MTVFPRITAPLEDPVAITQGDTGLMIDVAQDSKDDVWFLSSNTVYRLLTPIKGDADGNRVVDQRDLEAIARETLDGDTDTLHAQDGDYAASWGADVNGDGVIDARDLVALARILTTRTRPIAR